MLNLHMKFLRKKKIEAIKLFCGHLFSFQRERKSVFCLCYISCKIFLIIYFSWNVDIIEKWFGRALQNWSYHLSNIINYYISLPWYYFIKINFLLLNGQFYTPARFALKNPYLPTRLDKNYNFLPLIKETRFFQHLKCVPNFSNSGFLHIK